MGIEPTNKGFVPKISKLGVEGNYASSRLVGLVVLGRAKS